MDSILEKGSSLSPGFQVAVDASFVVLLAVLLALLVATKSYHFVFLTFLAFALWATVKWVVHELRQEKAQEETQAAAEKEAKSE